MTDLKPCPFCNAETTVKPFIGKFILCADHEKWCPMLLIDNYVRGYRTEDIAIEAWNTRHEQTCEMEYHTEGMKRGWWVCSKCDKAMDTIESCGGRKPPKFCGNCGAKVKQSVACRKADEETAARGDAEILEDPVKTWQK